MYHPTLEIFFIYNEYKHQKIVFANIHKFYKNLYCVTLEINILRLNISIKRIVFAKILNMKTVVPSYTGDFHFYNEYHHQKNRIYKYTQIF